MQVQTQDQKLRISQHTGSDQTPHSEPELRSGQFGFALKGHGFSRAVTAAQSIAASRWGNVSFKLTHHRNGRQQAKLCKAVHTAKADALKKRL
jgi:hypothetical protein